MRLRWLSAVALVALALTACGGSPITTPTETPTVPSPPLPTPTPATATARYRVTFQTSWSAATHPTDFPEGAHFSSLIGATHTDRAQFWQPGAAASNGIQVMAERGGASPLAAEVQAAIAQGTARQVLRGPGIGGVPGSASIEFEIDRDEPLVTLVSMVAPSPDWFTGVHDLSLIENGGWVGEKTVVLFAYDAGTDSGATYESADIVTAPRDVIRRIEGSPFLRGGTVAPVGTFTFSRL